MNSVLLCVFLLPSHKLNKVQIYSTCDNPFFFPFVHSSFFFILSSIEFQRCTACPRKILFSLYLLFLDSNFLDVSAVLNNDRWSFNMGHKPPSNTGTETAVMCIDSVKQESCALRTTKGYSPFSERMKCLR